MEPEKTPRERVEDLISLLLADWRPTPRQGLWAIRIAVAVAIVLSILALIGRPFDITLWDWLRVLAVPITIGVAVPWLNWLQKKRELAVEQKRAQDEALQAYLDQMSQLLIDKDRPLHRAQMGDSLSALARARTVTILPRLNSDQKARVLLFLYESRLIYSERPALDVNGANLRGVALGGWGGGMGVDLRGIYLSAAYMDEANLRGAHLKGADLRGTRLRGADLSHANLSGTALSEHDPSSGVTMGAGIQEANLSEANLSGATGWTGEKLLTAGSLEGATMPNGQKYEDWRKSKEG